MAPTIANVVSTLASNATATPSSSGNSASGFDISGLVFGVAGCVTLIPAVHSGLERRFPERRLKYLDEALDETIKLYATVVNEGLFSGSSVLKSFEHRLLNLRRDSDSLRAKVHIATTFKKQFRAWWLGLSKRLDEVRHEVETIRAEISLASENERTKLQRENRLHQPQLFPPGAYSARRGKYVPAVDSFSTEPVLSAVNPRIGITTSAVGLHNSSNSLNPRAHVYPPPYSHSLTAPPPAFVPSSSSPTGNPSSSAPTADPRQRFRELTEQLAQAAPSSSKIDHDIVHTPDHAACCNPQPGASEIERTVNVLTDLTKRLAVIAASELTRPSSNRGASNSKPQINPTQISLLIDALSSAQTAATQQSSAASNADVPSTATIEEIHDALPNESQS